MVEKFVKISSLLSMLLVAAVMSYAGGVDPGDIPPQTPVAREKVSATPEQTSAAVSKARRAVAPDIDNLPVVKQVSQPMSPAKAVTFAGRDGWLLSSVDGKCEPLGNVSRKVKSIGSFKTPQEFARQMQQRGYQAFALDIGEARDQMMRVKIPDLDLDQLFVRPGMCR